MSKLSRLRREYEGFSVRRQGAEREEQGLGETAGGSGSWVRGCA